MVGSYLAIVVLVCACLNGAGQANTESLTMLRASCRQRAEKESGACTNFCIANSILCEIG